MAEQPTLVQQPTSDDVTKIYTKLTEEGDDLYKKGKFTAAAGKYQEAVNMGSIAAGIKLADMIYYPYTNTLNSKPEYTLNYALELYTNAWLYGSRTSDSEHISYEELAKIKADLKQMGITDHNGGYKKRKSNRKRPSKRTRTRKHKWSLKYKRSIDCNHPKGFSQRQHCKYGRKNMRKLTRKK